MTFNPCPKPISLPKPPRGMRKRNAERASSEFKRTYGSRARQKFVNLMECSACGAWGYTVNAHVLGNDGGSRKGGYKTIAPLCGPRPDTQSSAAYPGCHNLFDEHQDEFRARFPKYSPKRAAAECQKRWLAFLRGQSPTSN